MLILEDEYHQLDLLVDLVEIIPVGMEQVRSQERADDHAGQLENDPEYENTNADKNQEVDESLHSAYLL